MKMKAIIPPVPLDILKEELSGDRFIRKTNKGGNKIYIINAGNAPNTLREIGRLRELSFRNAGGGTGLECDLDEYDTGENAYQQLIVWDPDEEAILGGYRFFICDPAKCIKNGKVKLATSKLFNFSEDFVSNYVPHMIELGRSFVQPKYQSTVGRTGNPGTRLSKQDIYVWESDHVPALSPVSQGYDPLLSEQALP